MSYGNMPLQFQSGCFLDRMSQLGINWVFRCSSQDSVPDCISESLKLDPSITSLDTLLWSGPDSNRQQLQVELFP